jgi:hypothetical protein
MFVNNDDIFPSQSNMARNIALSVSCFYDEYDEHVAPTPQYEVIFEPNN